MVDLETLTLEEKAALGSGASFWSTAAAPGLPAIVLTDGPHGVRAQRGDTDHLGISESEPATCFPPAAGLAQSWDPNLAARIGEALGRESRALGVGVLLGPGVNIKRDPRAGRNFEYFSEDPLLTGELGSAWVRGLQSQGVGASLKHFAVNDAEEDRMRSSSDVDARALREVHLRGFQRVVTDARPWTVMCSYNRINGVYAAENHWLLTNVLRGEWGFDGVVVSDWGAVRDRVAALEAGLDLEMPGGNRESVPAVVDAVRSGRLDETVLDRAAGNVVRLLDRAAHATAPVTVDFDAHHALAREAAGRSVALLKNEQALLPLPASGRIAVIGRFATESRFQGGGSSHVNATRVDVALEEIRALSGDAEVTYAHGFSNDPMEEERLRDEAVAVARSADVAVVFLGLTESQESEGFDRESIDLPEEQLRLLAAVARSQPHVVVVVSSGGVVRLREVNRLAASILAGALLGQAAGGGIADVLFGRVNPSGRLAETVPERLQDVPAYLDFPGEHSHVLYGESIHVGYRWYDARALDVTFPFGHGLSYTEFRYDELEVSADAAGIGVRVRVSNIGRRAGREVVQIYVAKPDSSIRRPVRELKAFGSVQLAPNEQTDLHLRVRREDLAYWEDRADGWVVEGGRWDVLAAASSRDVRLRSVVDVVGDETRVPFTEESTFGELLAHPVAGPVIAQAIGLPHQTGETTEVLGMDLARMMASVPLDRMAAMSAGAFDRKQLQQLLAVANGSAETVESRA